MLLFELVEALLVVVTGVALGWHVPGGLVPALGLLLLGTVAFAGIGLLMAGTLRAEANLAAANALFLVLLFLGGMAYPLAKLPGAMQAVAKALPAAALSDTVRSVLSTQAFPTGPARGARRVGRARAARRRPLVPLGGVSSGLARRPSVRSARMSRRARRSSIAGCERVAARLAVDAAAHDPVGVDEHGLRDARARRSAARPGRSGRRAAPGT